MKKIVFLIIVALCLFPFAVGAQTSIEMPDLSDADRVLNKNDYTYLLPSEILEGILKNEFQLSGESLFENLVNLLFNAVKKFLPEVLALFAVSIIVSVISKLEIINKNLAFSALLGGRIIVCVNLLTTFVKIAKSLKQSITLLVDFFQKLMPALSTAFVFSGAQNTSASMQGSASVFAFIVLKVICSIVLTLIIAACIILAINSLLPDNKLKGIGELFRSASSWVLGGAFTLFCGFSAITGISASVQDNMRLRSLKYAVNSSVPIIGSSVGESLNFVLAGAQCLRGGLGVTGMIVCLVIMFMPIINVLAIMLLLKLFSSLASAWTDEAIVKIANTVADGYKMLLITLLGICAVFLLFLGIISSVG